MSDYMTPPCEQEWTPEEREAFYTKSWPAPFWDHLAVCSAPSQVAEYFIRSGFRKKPDAIAAVMAHDDVVIDGIRAGEMIVHIAMAVIARIMRPIDNALYGLPEQVPSDGYFCSGCHEEVDPEKFSEPIEYDTNAGGRWYESRCCSAEVYSSRYVLWLSPGRPPRYIYPDASKLESDGSEESCDDYF